MNGAIFDWDGTLVDIDDREFYCINHALQAHGVDRVDHEFYVKNYYCRPFEVGTGPRMVMDAALLRKKVKVEDVYDTYRKVFAETINRTRFQLGAKELLNLLRGKGVKIGIATMRFTRAVVASELDTLGVDSLADVLLTREDLGLGRTLKSLEETVDQRVQLVSHALERLKLHAQEVFLVGDSWWDIRAGKQLGLKTVLVRTGFSFHNDFSSEKPDLMLGSLAELEAEIRAGKWPGTS